MKFWTFMLLMVLIIPFTMIGFGRYFQKKHPKNINPVFGYRTKMSMKNQDTWEFAHTYSGRLWQFWGQILLPLSLLPMLFVGGKDADTVGWMGGAVCMIQTIFLVGTIFPTERAMKRTFDENGIRRN